MSDAQSADQHSSNCASRKRDPYEQRYACDCGIHERNRLRSRQGECPSGTTSNPENSSRGKSGESPALLSSNERIADSAAREDAWHSFANSEPAPTHKDCFHAGWVSGKDYERGVPNTPKDLCDAFNRARTWLTVLDSEKLIPGVLGHELREFLEKYPKVPLNAGYGDETPTEPPYFIRTFWSPDARYLVTAHATPAGIITLQDDNGKEWRAIGPQEDMANRCHCGAYEWKSTTGRITDPQGRLHLKERCFTEKTSPETKP